MSPDGMSIVTVDKFGEVSDEEAVDFKDATIQNIYDIQSVEVTDETEMHTSGMAYA